MPLYKYKFVTPVSYGVCMLLYMCVFASLMSQYDDQMMQILLHGDPGRFHDQICEYSGDCILLRWHF